MKVGLHRIVIVAAFTVVGAASMVSCSKKDTGPTEPENILTARSDTLTITQSENGKPKMRFYAPLMEQYAHAPEPYEEYPKGIELETYDSIGNSESRLVANYALFWSNLKRWDLKGDVVYYNTDGDKLETQQLSWNQKSEQVWSNVQTRLTRNKGDDQQIGTSFIASQDLSKWRFRHVDGVQSFDAEPTRKDSVQ